MAFKGESTQNVRRLARKQGMHTLFEDGMIKAIRGMTTIDEVLRITQREMLTEATAAEEVVSGRPAIRGRPGWRARWTRASWLGDGRSQLGLAARVSRGLLAFSKRLCGFLISVVSTEIMMQPGAVVLILTSKPGITNRWTPGFWEKVK